MTQKLLKEVTTRELVSILAQDVQESRVGFVPLVGSGLSIESGIPSGALLGPYLDRVMYDCLLNEWDLHELGWPSLRRRGPKLSDYVKGRATDPPGTSAALDLGRKAVAGANDWRSSVFFLARLNQWAGEQRELAPDYSIIDALADLLTRDSQPNAGHRTLALSARALRISTVLTTNFDSLLERAFDEAHHSLLTFDIPAEGALPGADRVLAQPTILKLHGSRVGVRADFSLDERPTDEDRLAFASYLVGYPNPKPGHWKDASFITTRRHLLVLGFGGMDARVAELVTYASFATGQKIVWIAHQRSEVAHLQRTLAWCQKLLRDEDVLPAAGHSELGYVAVESARLFLQELYTAVTHTLPARGPSYAFLSNVAPPPWKRSPEAVVKEVCSLVAAPAAKLLLHGGEDEVSLFPVVALIGERGVSSTAAELYWALSGQPRTGACDPKFTEPIELDVDKFQCAWFELSHFSHPRQLVAAIVREIALQIGRLDSDFVSTRADNALGALERLGVEPGHWVVFLYGRGVPGSDAAYTASGAPPWTSHTYEELHELLKALRRMLRFVHMPFDETRKRYLKDHKRPERAEAETCPPWMKKHLVEALSTPSADDMVKAALDWAKDDTVDPSLHDGLRNGPPSLSQHEIVAHKAAFLYGLTLCRRPRDAHLLHSVALFSCPWRFNLQGWDNDELRARYVERWIDDLARFGLLRVRPGGSVWMNRDIRRRLKQKLELQGLQRWCASTHMRIAEALERAFFATNDPVQAFEALFHLAQADAQMSDDTSHWLRRERCLVRSLKVLRSAQFAIRRRADEHILYEVERASETAKPEEPAESTSPAQQRVHERVWLLSKEWARLEWMLKQLIGPRDARGKLKKSVEWPEDGSEGRVGRLPKVEDQRLQARRCSLAGADDDAIKSLEAAASSIEVTGAVFLTLKEWPMRSPEQLRESMREEASKWLAARPGTRAQRDEEVRALVAIMRELCVVRLRKLERDSLCCWSRDPDDLDWARAAELERPNRPFAATISMLCGLTLEMAGLLSPDASDSEELAVVVVESTYAVALSHLTRFTEAHRHLNIAFARLSRSVSERRDERWGILELRRAAINLRQAQAVCMDELSENKRSVPARLRAVAHLDDAWSALTRARDALAGKNRIPDWWGELYMLELRALSTYSELQPEAPEERPDASTNQPKASGSPKIVGLPDRTPDRRLDRTAERIKSEELLFPIDKLRASQVLHAGALALYGEFKRLEDRGQGRYAAVKYLHKTIKASAARLETDVPDHPFVEAAAALIQLVLQRTEPPAEVSAEETG